MSGRFLQRRAPALLCRLKPRFVPPSAGPLLPPPIYLELKRRVKQQGPR